MESILILHVWVGAEAGWDRWSGGAGWVGVGEGVVGWGGVGRGGFIQFMN